MTPETARLAVQVFLSHYPGRLNSIFFFGGEPLLSWRTIRDVVDFTLRFCQEHRVAPPRFAVQTNGTLLDDRKAAYLKDHDFLVTVSLDGPPLVNDAQRVFVRGNGTYEKVVRSISQLIDHDIKFNIEATITRSHIKSGVSVPEVFDHLIHLGAYCVHIMPVTGPYPNLRLETSVIEQVVKQFADVAIDSVSSLATDHPRRLQYVLYVVENLVMGAQKYICYAGLGTATIGIDGNIYPCYFLTHENLLMGNIYDMKLWEQYRQVQTRMAGHRKEHVWPCRACWARNLCNACYGAESSAEKTLSAPASEVCLIQQGIIDSVLSELVKASSDPERWSKLMQNLTNEFGVSD